MINTHYWAFIVLKYLFKFIHHYLIYFFPNFLLHYHYHYQNQYQYHYHYQILILIPHQYSSQFLSFLVHIYILLKNFCDDTFDMHKEQNLVLLWTNICMVLVLLVFFRPCFVTKVCSYTAFTFFFFFLCIYHHYHKQVSC